MGSEIDRSAYLTLAVGWLAAIGLWLGLWPLAAIALAFLVRGRPGPMTLAADTIVFVGLAGHADPLWVGLLVVASLVAREHDPRTIVILLFAAVAAIFVSLDWTILTGLLAALRIAFVARRALSVPGVFIRRGRSSRARR